MHELSTTEGAQDLMDALEMALPKLEIGSFEHEQLQQLLEDINKGRSLRIAPAV